MNIYKTYYDCQRPDEAHDFWERGILPDWAYEEIGRQQIRRAMDQAVANHEYYDEDAPTTSFERAWVESKAAITALGEWLLESRDTYYTNNPDTNTCGYWPTAMAVRPHPRRDYELAVLAREEGISVLTAKREYNGLVCEPGSEQAKNLIKRKIPDSCVAKYRHIRAKYEAQYTEVDDGVRLNDNRLDLFDKRAPRCKNKGG